jgi:hypothetical protein
MSVLYELTEALTRYAEYCHEYCLDLEAVDDISEGGMVLLSMFVSHAQRHGQALRINGCSAIASRAIVQIPVLGTLLHSSGKIGAKPAHLYRRHACQNKPDFSAAGGFAVNPAV